LGVCINIALNIVLIPRFGINGSASATLITQIIISYLFDALSPGSRELFYLRTRVFIFFIPMTYRIIFKKRA
jgi:PST family polysaccharide transporter